MDWVVLLLAAFLSFLAVRKIPVIQFLAGLLLLGLVLCLIVRFVPPDPRPVLQGRKFSPMIFDMKEVNDRLGAYKADHEDALPERLSQLFPDYIDSKDARCFFDRRSKDFQERCKKAAADPTEVDRNGAIDYFAGKVGGMLAAGKTPIEKEIFYPFFKYKKLIRLILENDGKIKFVPEEEYQRRLNGGMPKER